MPANLVSFFFVTALAIGCSKGDQGQEKTAEADGAAIFEMVSSAMSAGFISHDFDTYIAVFSDDAVLIAGRSEEVSATDITLSRQQIEDTKRLRFAGKAGTLRSSIPEHKVRVAGKEATLEWRMVFQADGYWEEAKEVFKLRKTEGGWRVYENRYWVVAEGTPEAPIAIDAATWADRDLAVDNAAGSPLAKVGVLAEAMRWPEAHTILMKLTSEEPTRASHWSQRALAALMIGKVPDAKLAACEARNLDPKQPLPHWAKLLTCPANPNRANAAGTDAGAAAALP